MFLFYRQICYYCSLQGHATVHGGCFGFAGVLLLQKGFPLLEELIPLTLVWSQALGCLYYVEKGWIGLVRPSLGGGMGFPHTIPPTAHTQL